MLFTGQRCWSGKDIKKYKDSSECCVPRKAFHVPFWAHAIGSPVLPYTNYLVITGGKVARHCFNNLPPFSVKVKERVELCVISPCRPSWQVIG